MDCPSRVGCGALAGWIAAGQLKPLVSKTYRFADAAQALEDMMNRRVLGKVALTVD